MRDTHTTRGLSIIGGGPAGLMAAEVARAAGVRVDLFEGKGSVGRKFLVAGKGGLNLTHGEPFADFVTRFRARSAHVARWLEAFGPDALRNWARGLGVETFVGSSGRVFPTDLKAAPLMRRWVQRLRDDGVRFHVRHRWSGWTPEGALRFETPDGVVTHTPGALLLALGGGSWPQLGSDGGWVPLLAARGVSIAPLLPSNCGFDIGWSAHLASRFAGAPLKPVVAHWHDPAGQPHALQGECVLTPTGIEGSLVYALSADLRGVLQRDGHVDLLLDLCPGRTLERLQADLARPRGKRSIGEHLRRQAGLDAAKAALLFERLPADLRTRPDAIARWLKRLPLRLVATRPIAEAISSAGGVRLEALDGQLRLHSAPTGVPYPVFCAGEMLDWDAPTGGYLLTASMASGVVAGRAAAAALHQSA